MFKHWFIEKLGGFPTIQSALAHIRETDDEAKHELLQQAVRDLFLAVSPEDILQVVNGRYTFLGKPMSQEQVAGLQLEAETLKKMRIWAVLRYDVRYRLSQKMFEEGKYKDDFIWGQLATFLWDIMKTRLDQIARIKV